eukprot:3288732-Amphidinium_carterae.1
MQNQTLEDLAQLAAHLHTYDVANVAILGDFNLDAAGRMPRYLADFLLDAHWVAAQKAGTVPGPTCITPTSASRADGLYCTPSMMELICGCQALDWGTLPVHRPLIFQLHCQSWMTWWQRPSRSMCEIPPPALEWTDFDGVLTVIRSGLTSGTFIHNGPAYSLLVVAAIDTLCWSYPHPPTHAEQGGHGGIETMVAHAEAAATIHATLRSAHLACLYSELVQARQHIKQTYRQKVLAYGCISGTVSARLRQTVGAGACSLVVDGSRTFLPTELFPLISRYWQPLMEATIISFADDLTFFADDPVVLMEAVRVVEAYLAELGISLLAELGISLNAEKTQYFQFHTDAATINFQGVVLTVVPVLRILGHEIRFPAAEEDENDTHDSIVDDLELYITRLLPLRLPIPCRPAVVALL